MDTVAGGSMRLLEGSRSLIHTAFVASVKRAIASGDLRSDTEPNDFVRALIGVFHTTALPGWEPSARRLVDILIAGSRSTPKHRAPPSARGRNSEARTGREVVHTVRALARRGNAPCLQPTSMRSPLANPQSFWSG